MATKRKARKDKGKSRKRTYRPRVICECGMQYFDGGGRSFHLNSVFHRKHKRIVKLLATNCLTFQEIGDRIGVSRERVRQIVEKIKATTADDRRAACLITRADLRWRKAIKGTRVERFIKDAESRGLTCDRIASSSNSNRWLISKIRVAGHLINFKHAHSAGNYTALHGASTHGVTVYELPDSRWLIAPERKGPKRQTMFALNEPSPIARVRITKTLRHDYREMINDWSVFTNGHKA